MYEIVRKYPAQGEFLQIDTAELMTFLGCKNDINVYTTVSHKGMYVCM